MKYSKLGLLLLAAALYCGSLFPITAKADVAVSFDYFYDSLDPYGEWIEVPDYGYCWRPTNVDPDWAPYTDGYWANTDAGWTWVSYEDFGGITYHYGRWARIPEEGWMWVPDYEWAPAWVSWRYSDDYVGWAPLPPRAHWQPEVGISFWVDDYCDIGPTYYNFCEVRNFGSPALRPVIIDRSRNVTIINKTTNITNITVNKTTNIIYNGGPSLAVVSSRSLKPIQTLRLERQTDVGDWRNNRGPTMARQKGNELFVVAPRVAPATAAKARPQRIAKVLPTANIDTGWAGVPDPKVRQELHAKFKREVGNVKPEQAPATAPSQRDLSAFEQRIKTQPVAPATPDLKHRETVVPNQAGPAVFATPAQGKGKKGKHGEDLRPFVQPAPQPGGVVPNDAQVPSRQVTHPDKYQEQQLQQIPQQKPVEDQNRVLEKQRKQEANQEQLMRAREERQRALEAQAAQRQQIQAQRAQEEASRRDREAAQSAQAAQQRQQMQMQRSQEESIRREREAQAAQQRQQMQMQRSQEESIRRERDAQAAQQRQEMQAQRAQEESMRRERAAEAGQQRRMEAPQRQIERAPQPQQQSGGIPSEGKKHGKDKGDKDRDSDR